MELMDRETITKAIDWIHSVQRPDGSWYGSWYVPLLLLLVFSFITPHIMKEAADKKGNLLHIRNDVRS
jgi:hypothetical protein